MSDKFPLNKKLLDTFQKESTTDGKAHESILFLTRETVMQLIMASYMGDDYATSMIQGFQGWLSHVKQMSRKPQCTACENELDVYKQNGINDDLKFVAIMPQRKDASVALIGGVCPTCSKMTNMEIARAISTLMHGGPPSYVGMRGMH